ncbi:MAG: hypothetical protein K2Q03_05830, partial [Sphingobacteriaceae bacterium]|nr:hypothetical protein [Sphingobacteriaceae bacterium]
MKAYLAPNFIKRIKNTAIIPFIIVFLAGCSSTKYLNDDQSIIKRIKLDSIPKEIRGDAFNYVRNEILPNSKINFGTFYYNLVNTKKGKYKTQNIRNVGKPPVILDSSLVNISKIQLEKYIKSKGYFNAQVEAKINIKNKKARIYFVAKPGSIYTLNEINSEITDTTLNNLYQKNYLSFTHLHKGAKFSEDSLVHDRDHLYQIIKENGYYNFSKSYIKLSLDSNLSKNRVNVKLIIDNPKDKDSHTKYTIGETDILIAPNYEGLTTDSVLLNKQVINGVKYTDLSKRINPSILSKYNFLKENEEFNLENETLTYNRFSDLNIFKSIKIDYNVNDSTKKVSPFIFLIPQARVNNTFGVEFTFNQNTSDISLNNTFVNNNLFKGAERLEIQTRGVIRSLKDGFSFFNNIYYRDFLLSTSLSIPKLLAPYSHRLKSKYGTPSTNISLSYLYSSQQNISIRKIYLANFRYDWFETKSKIHSLMPLNFEYKDGSFSLDTASTEGKDFFNKNRYYVKLLDRKDLTFGLKYSYTLNANKLRLNANFVYLRAEFDIAGNALGLATRLFDKHDYNDGARLALGLPYNQYIKPELDIRWYR